MEEDHSPSPPQPGADPPQPPRSDLPPMCIACGQMLTERDEKCPSCGAQIRGRGRSRGLDKLKIAGFVLIGIFLLTVFFGGTLIWGGEGVLSQGATLPGQTFDLEGNVVDANGTAVANVTVASLESDHNATTGPDGAYHLADMPGGVNRVEFEGPGNATAVVRFFLYQDTDAEVVLPGDNTSVAHTHESFDLLLTIFNVCGALMLALALLFLAGGIACYRRRNFPLALTAAILSFLPTVLYLPLLLLSVVAVVLIARSRGDFR